MSKDPNEIINQYLERIAVYLPMNSEEYLTEIRTHLIYSAEEFGEGKLSQESVYMAIDKIGDPKMVASEYTRSGKKVGPIPKEYVSPSIRVFVVLMGVSIAFIIGSYLVGVTWPDMSHIRIDPLNLVMMLIVNLVIVLVIIGGIVSLEDEWDPEEKTVLEEILGIGSDSFKPKKRSDAARDTIAGIAYMMLLGFPQVQAIFTSSFIQYIPLLIILTMFGVCLGLLYYTGGENNLTLLVDGILGIIWVIFSMVLIHVGWPLQSIWLYDSPTATWQLVDFSGIFITSEFNDLIFNPIWIIFIFIIVVSDIWRVLKVMMKISIYLHDGRGLWWQGE
jgi:hypothetical protein